MTRQLYGEDKDPSLWRPWLVCLVVAAFCIISWLTTSRPPDLANSILGGKKVRQDTGLGANRDQQGCLAAAGYVWCDGAGKCVRPWKDSCPGGTEFCQNHCAKDAEKNAQAAKGVAGSHSVFCLCADGKALDYSPPKENEAEKEKEKGKP
mmetsp:Transcript_70941/g.203288  ORF Transcript_70941/g.203288 Transcript_70941/m.203288 type:complete len:150 (+) Transcript_70941:123-572(+)